MEPATLGIALLVSVLINFWQFNVNGELEAQNDNLTGIVKQCTVDREQERRTTIEAADVREQQAEALGRELAGQEQYTRDVLKNANDSCLDSHSPLGSELVDREQQTTDSLNGIWVRGTGSPYD